MPLNNVSFEYYRTVFGCGSAVDIPPESFALYRRKAAEEISMRLFKEPSEEHAESLRMAVCEVAELIFAHHSKLGLKSENIDGYSVTYADSDKLSSSINSVLCKHLSKTGLLYRGV